MVITYNIIMCVIITSTITTITKTMFVPTSRNWSEFVVDYYFQKNNLKRYVACSI